MAFTVLSFAASSLLTSTKMTQLYDNTDDNRFATGTIMVFFQAAAPSGWTQDTSHNDKALRVVSGSGGGSAGTLGVSAPAVAGHILTISELAAHTHTFGVFATSGSGNLSLRGGGPLIASPSTAGTGADAAHDHGLALLYIDVIIAAKD